MLKNISFKIWLQTYVCITFALEIDAHVFHASNVNIC